LHRTDRPFRLDRFKEHDVEIVMGILAARRGKEVHRHSITPAPTKSPQQLIDETLKLGRGTLLALADRGSVTVHST
jgi:hypothetical protein